MSTAPGPEEVGTSWTRHNLSDHDDVDTTGDTDSQVVAWDATAGKWVGKDASDLGVFVFGTTDPADGSTVWSDGGTLKSSTSAAEDITLDSEDLTATDVKAGLEELFTTKAPLAHNHDADDVNVAADTGNHLSADDLQAVLADLANRVYALENPA